MCRRNSATIRDCARDAWFRDLEFQTRVTPLRTKPGTELLEVAGRCERGLFKALAQVGGTIAIWNTRSASWEMVTRVHR